MSAQLTAYTHFNRQEWRALRQDMEQPLTEADLDQLHGQIETVSLPEITEIYLPLSRLLSYYVTATQALHQATNQFLLKPEPKVPYVIGVSGSVAVGKSATSRVLQALLSHWPNHPSVALVQTDGFLYPNDVLASRGLMARKGFPESYDLPALLRFLVALKSGQRQLKVPIYSHHHYDIVPGSTQEIEQPDVLIIEGLNILQSSQSGLSQPQYFVSDFLDFSIFVDADPRLIEAWYVERFQRFRLHAFQDPGAYFHRFAFLNPEETEKTALRYWREINGVNLQQNILPFKQRAKLILTKEADHRVESVYLRRI